eukprot:NODE_616_length_5370_cov_0.348131.p6 type:complete len:184 gc:universal NODE_616_length_5370_cov_0.348131:3954-4505(+)
MDNPLYLEYLDSFLNANDKKYIDDIDTARKLVFYGFRGIIEPPVVPIVKTVIVKKLFTNKDALGVELSNRESKILDGDMDTVIFVKIKDKSAYIDLRSRIKKRKSELKPCKSDLAYMNWSNKFTTCNDTETFQAVMTEDGFFIRHIVKRWTITPSIGGQFINKSELKIPGYDKLVFYDLIHQF